LFESSNLDAKSTQICQYELSKLFLIFNLSMKKILACIILLLVFKNNFAQNDSLIESIKNFQNSLNEDYKNPEESPLSKKDLKTFTAHDFYEIDTNYYVKAKLIKTPEEKTFGMITTTERKPEYVKFGHLIFDLNGQTYQLDVFQMTILTQKEGYEKYLFLPFTDSTNGNETYHIGRYIDLTIPDGDEIMIDFNKSYNPYCAYSHDFSCPVPPEQNHLKTYIKAGIKKP